MANKTQTYIYILKFFASFCLQCFKHRRTAKLVLVSIETAQDLISFIRLFYEKHGSIILKGGAKVATCIFRNNLF